MRSSHSAPAVTEQIIIDVEPVDAHGRFSARLDGRLIVASSSTPFCDGARRLLELGCDPAASLIMRHGVSMIDALRGPLRVAAGLTVEEGHA
jgi:hypothetical protein